MCNFIFRFRNFCLGLLLAGLAAGPSTAQAQQLQARNYQNNRTFNTTSPELAVDDLLSTSATMTPPALGSATLRVTFPSAVQPGQQGILVIKATTALATVLGSMRLRTYLTTAQDPDASIQDIPMSDSSLVNISTAPSDPDAHQVKFTATQPFNQIEVVASALLNTNYSVDVFAAFGSVAPLPVQLTAFAGKATETGATLSWETASEQRAAYFEVQRADGPTAGFHSLGQVKSAGTSTQKHHYQFADAAPAGRHYYRLRQVDLDGAASFGPVVAVETGLLAGLTAYPSFATRTLHVSGPAGAHLGIFNEQGRQVQATDMATSQRQQLDVSNLPGGVYFLRDINTGLTTRFVKASDH